ncbi:hypothetical protein D3C84_274820 [compost metagenome]
MTILVVDQVERTFTVHHDVTLSATTNDDHALVFSLKGFHQLHVEQATAFPVLVVEPVMTVCLEAHHSRTDDRVDARQVKFKVRYVGDLHVGDGSVSLVHAFSDDLLGNPVVVVEHSALGTLNEQLAVVRRQGDTNRRDLTDRDVGLLSPHAVLLAVGGVRTPLVDHRHTERDGRRLAGDRSQLDLVDLVVTDRILHGLDLVTRYSNARFLHGHNGVQDVTLQDLLDVLTVHLLDGRLQHRLVTHRFHFWIRFGFLKDQIFLLDLQGGLNSLGLVPWVWHCLVGFCQTLHAAILRCRQDVLLHQLVDLVLDRTGQGVFGSAISNDLRDRFDLGLVARLNDQLTVFVSHLCVVVRSGWFVQGLGQFFLFFHEQVFSTVLFQRLLLLLLFFSFLFCIVSSRGLLLGLDFLSRDHLDWVGLVDDLGEQLQEPHLHDLRIKALTGFHRDAHVRIKGVIPCRFHGDVALVSVFEVEVFTHRLFNE